MQGPVTIVVNEGAHGGDRRVHGQLHEILSRTPEPPVRIVFTSPGTGVRELSLMAPCTVPDGTSADLFTVVTETADGLELRIESRGGPEAVMANLITEKLYTPVPDDAGIQIPSE